MESKWCVSFGSRPYRCNLGRYSSNICCGGSIIRRVSVENNFRQMDISILATSSGLALANRENWPSFNLCFATRWDLRYKNITSLTTRWSVNPIISPVSTRLKKFWQVSKYFSSFKRKYKNILESIKMVVCGGTRERLVNPFFLLAMADNFLEGFVVYNSFDYFRELRDNFRLWFLNNLDRIFSCFHFNNLPKIALYNFTKYVSRENLCPWRIPLKRRLYFGFREIRFSGVLTLVILFVTWIAMRISLRILG